jgi:MraZ protein
MVMPPSEFRRLAEKVERDESLEPGERRKFIRQFSSRAQHVTGDKQGRIVLPDEQCKQLKLQGDVVLVGAYWRFEIWSPALWQKTVNDDTAAYRYMMDKVGI